MKNTTKTKVVVRRVRIGSDEEDNEGGGGAAAFILVWFCIFSMSKNRNSSVTMHACTSHKHPSPKLGQPILTTTTRNPSL
ncbi:hypothetical protein YC2023_086969 [Brassica napus]